MITYCMNCNEVLTCSKRECLCEDCIEHDFEEETGQLCESKMEKEYPKVILCPKCETELLLDIICFGTGG